MIVKKAAFKAMLMAMVVSLLCVSMTRNVPAAGGQCNGAPAVSAVTPSSGSPNVPQDLLVSGSNFRQANGTSNVTGISAIELGNPTNVIPATTFVVLNANLIDALFNFGAADACKDFRIIVTGPCGSSTNSPASRFLTSCPPGPCTGTPLLLSVTPSNGSADIPQDVLLSGANFTQTSGASNVTSAFAVELGNPSNVVQATSFVVVTPNLIDAIFNFGSANACKTFRILVSGPCGTSASNPQVEFRTNCPTAAQRIANLKNRVIALRTAGVLSNKEAEKLIKRLDKAAEKLEDGHENQAVNQLEKFIDDVQKLIDHGELTPAQGQPLIDEANSIIAQINQ